MNDDAVPEAALPPSPPDPAEEGRRFRRLLARAARKLGRRPMSRRELIAALEDPEREPESDPALLARVADRCQELGYLDDAAFARQRTAWRLERCGWGPARLRLELRRKGVDEPLIQEALARQTEELAPEAGARQALRRRFGESPAADGSTLRRMRDFLARRGFDGATIRRAIGEDYFRRALRGLPETAVEDDPPPDD
ncbi:MAG: RecX family transcriptional regulator [Magnetococcales bacterium]|nr:RecX family transcriptional regulator [Magnetococcales bacterium]